MPASPATAKARAVAPICSRRASRDLIIGEDPFMVGKIWEKMFAATYGREPSTRGWAQTAIISAMAPD